MILEEPESHLYPQAQSEVAQLLGMFLNAGNQMLLTTHSPYILGEINNLLYAGNLADQAKEQVNCVVAENMQVHSDRTSAYYMDDGRMRDIMDEEIQLIRNSVIDGISDIINDQNEKLVGEEGYNIDSLVAAHPASPVSAYLFMRNFATRMDYDGVKAIRDKFDASLDTTVYVKQIDDLLGRLVNLRVGATAPDFTLNDPDGKPVSLSSLRGKYVLVDFWASWCPDCRKENPNILAAYKKYQNKNFTVLGVSLDRKKEPWVAAIEKDGLTWTHVSDLQGWDTPVADLYVIKWIPKNYLIDPEGVILASGLEGEALDTKLAEVLK